MDDSTAMTVEFLRARLLSERSVSKSAKQRVDELAQKVVELEEQLKVATAQRKKAEKAAVEVLEILENNGISDFSGSFDSNSDQERFHFESKEDKNSAGEEKSTTPRLSKNEIEQVSGSDHEGSPLSGRSLSWKSCNSSPNSLEKKKKCIESKKMQCSFVLIGGSSTRLQRGKSCRKIKRKETMSTTDEMQDVHADVVNEEASGAGNNSDCVNDKPKVLKENNEEEVLPRDQGSQQDPPNENVKSPIAAEAQQDDAMENEFEKQAQLIGRYEAEENAQREWEERFEGNNSCILDSCQHDNQSKTTEAKEEIRGTVDPPDTICSEGQQAELEGKEVSTDHYSSSTVSLGMGCSQDQQCNNKPNTDGQTDSDFSFPSQEIPRSPTKGEEKRELSNIASQDDSSQHSAESALQNDLQLAIWHEKPNELDGVLEALQRAKLSLKHELNKSSSTPPAWPVLRANETLPDDVESMAIPNSCAGLFRVPTDLADKGTTRMNFSLSQFESKVCLDRNYPELGVSRSDQYNISPKFEIGQRDSSLKPYFDPWMDAGMALPASSSYKYPSYADLMPRMPSDGVPQTFTSIRPEMLIGDHSSIQNNHGRSNMYYRY